ncbi:MAG: hypothetical protein QW478_15775 [Candidatus Micrarchaeaceae archaeon]
MRGIKRWTVEYHYNPNRLVKKFKSSGFPVEVKSSGGISHNKSTKTTMTTGTIYAQLIEE